MICLFSLIKDYKQRPKYGEIMRQPFFIRSQEEDFDVAGWYKDVTTAAMAKERRWLSICMRICLCTSDFFLHRVIHIFIFCFLFQVQLKKSFVLYHQAYLVCLVKEIFLFPLSTNCRSFSFFLVLFAFFLFLLCNMYMIVIRRCFYEKRKKKDNIIHIYI